MNVFVLIISLISLILSVYNIWFRKPKEITIEKTIVKNIHPPEKEIFYDFDFDIIYVEGSLSRPERWKARIYKLTNTGRKLYCDTKLAWSKSGAEWEAQRIIKKIEDRK